MIPDYITKNASHALYALPAVILAVHVLPWLWDSHRLRKYPGPFLAKFSDLWLGCTSKMGHRSDVIHELHLKYGPIVRIAPNHISVADPDGLQPIYGHGNGALKSDFYDAFVNISPGVFSVRDRNEHARKRKIVSHIFSKQSVLEFEPYIKEHVGTLLKQWDRLHDMAMKGMSGNDGEGWSGSEGRLWLDCLPWSNYLAFDIIGNLAFGGPFGMLERAADIAVAPKNQKRMMESYGKEATDEEVIAIPAVQILNSRGEFAMSMGAIPPHWRPTARRLPGFRQGDESVRIVAGIAIAAVAKRMLIPTDRVDLLSRLQAGKDSEGNPMGREELTGESLALLIAGSDTTSNSICAILYYLAQNRHVREKLHKELDEQLGTEDEFVASSNQAKRLPYMHACIDEALRLHSTSSLGLPRIAPADGLFVLDQYFPAGTVLSVPSYSIHRNKEAWGDDADIYRPERWFERDQAAIQKAFNPFSVGPRSCVGRNLGILELQIAIASIMRRYDIILRHPNQKLETREGFLRKPLKCLIGIKRRHM